MSHDAPGGSPDEEPLYVDEQGIPTLFDVVVAGDKLRSSGVALVHQPPARPAASADEAELDRRIRAAIDAALPKVTKRTASVLRDALFEEVRDDLRDQAGNGPQADRHPLE